MNWFIKAVSWPHLNTFLCQVVLFPQRGRKWKVWYFHSSILSLVEASFPLMGSDGSFSIMIKVTENKGSL
jgi:hypothetical protein